MKKTKLVIMVIIVIFNILAQPMEAHAYAGESIWQEMDLDNAEDSFKSMFPEYHFDGKRVLSLIAQGKIMEAVSALISGLVDTVKAQFSEIRTLFVMILILGITAALFSDFADVFQNHQVSDIAFYFIYLMLITVLIKSFGNAASIVREMINKIITLYLIKI